MVIDRVRIKIVGALFVLYKGVISPFFVMIFGNTMGCRFNPTCSVYARNAIIEWGWIRGVWLAIKRLASCHPFGSGGNDPVPLRQDANIKRKAFINFGR